MGKMRRLLCWCCPPHEQDDEEPLCNETHSSIPGEEKTGAVPVKQRDEFVTKMAKNAEEQLFPSDNEEWTPAQDVREPVKEEAVKQFTNEKEQEAENAHKSIEQSSMGTDNSYASAPSTLAYEIVEEKETNRDGHEDQLDHGEEKEKEMEDEDNVKNAKEDVAEANAKGDGQSSTEDQKNIGEEETKHSLESLGYHFDKEGHLRDENEKPFVFTTQAAYEMLGEAMTEELYSIMENRGLKRTYLRNEDDLGPDSNYSFVFASEEYDQKETLLVLIHGSGAVRAGQWARQLILNEDLKEGSQLPYIDRALENDWGVVVFNTNYNSYKDGNGSRRYFPYSETPEKHGHSAWGGLVSKVSKDVLKRIFVVAHSAGGSVISYIVGQNFPDAERIRMVALTDSWFHGDARDRPFIINWIASTSAKPTKSSRGRWQVSAGTSEHTRSSAAAFSHIFKVFENDPETEEELEELLGFPAVNEQPCPEDPKPSIADTETHSAEKGTKEVEPVAEEQLDEAVPKEATGDTAEDMQADFNN